MAMYSAQYDQDKINIESENSLKKVLSEYVKFLCLFKKTIEPVYMGSAYLVSRYSISEETVEKCDKLIELINNILSGKQSLSEGIFPELLQYHCKSIEKIVQKVLDAVYREMNTNTKKLYANSDKEISEAIKNELTIKFIVKRLDFMVSAVSRVYNAFDEYSFI